jgi:hypothetical protein
VAEGGVAGVVGRDHDRTLGDSAAEHAHARRELDGSHPLAAPAALDPGIVGETQVPAGRIHQVHHRAVRVEQARGLLDRGGQESMDVTLAAVGVVAALRPRLSLLGRRLGGRGLGVRLPARARWDGHGR